MSRHRKMFQCGHKGYGQICHRCLQEEVTKQEHQEKKRTWHDSFAFDPIDLKDLPSHVVLKDHRRFTRPPQLSRIWW
jgi:hypothetical protein